MPLDQSPWARARWLVLAPHADDETLGAGALVVEASSAKRLAGVAYLTDGTGSHPAATPKLADTRKREASLALRRLAGAEPPILWIGWRDAHPHSLGSSPFERSRDRLGAVLRRWRVDAVAVTAAQEPHCDHAAAFLLAQEAIRRARRRVSLFEYHVWSEVRSHQGQVVKTRSIPLGQRRQALRAHQSQLTASMGTGFRLQKEDQRMSACDRLYLRRAR